MAILKSTQKNMLAAIGITGTAADIVVQETAQLRHDSRVADARTSALIWAERWMYQNLDDKIGHDISSDGEYANTLSYASVKAQAAGLCLLDQLGIGGVDGVSGNGTDRVPCFNHLGSGRKFAHDGGAWDAAIEQALHELMPGAGYDDGEELIICPIIPEDGFWHGPENQTGWGRNEAGVGVVLPKADKWADYRSDFIPIPVPSVISVLNEQKRNYDYRWHWTLARECLRRSLASEGVKSWFPKLGFVITGTPEQWSVVVNELSRIMKLEEVERAILVYYETHPGENVELHKYDGGREMWYTACAMIEKEKVPECVELHTIGQSGDIIPAIKIEYRTYAEREWWELR